MTQADVSGTAGRFFLVVGRSGVGKDTLLDGARATLKEDDRFVFVRRSITRPADSGGEDHEALTEDEFARRKEAGAFFLTWSAHGLQYGLPRSALDRLAEGKTLIANGSRATIAEFTRVIPRSVIVEVTAPGGLIAGRLERRGREAASDISARLSRKVEPLPSSIEVVRVTNDSDIESGVTRLVAVLKGRGPDAD